MIKDSVMDAILANRLGASVRAADPDRYFSALFAPPAARPWLFALYAFNHEVARVAETVREPMLGAIRLEWWRETVEGAPMGAPRNHDVAKGLAALFQAHAAAACRFRGDHRGARLRLQRRAFRRSGGAGESISMPPAAI